jgi:hypothetical protein
MLEVSFSASDLATILRAGGLRDDDESIATLRAGLDRLQALYAIMALSLDAPGPGEHKASLDALVEAVRAIGQILDDDFATGSLLNAALAGAGAEVTAAVRDWLRRVPIEAGELYLMIERNSHPRPRRRETIETWCFCALHDLFVVLNPGGGADAKLRKFVAAVVQHFGWAVRIPEGDNFRLRLKEALRRRPGPVNLLPLIIDRPLSPKR